MPADIVFNANHVGAQGAYEPQRKNNFTLIIDPPAGLDANITAVIRLALKSFNFPRESNAVIPVSFQNEQRKFAGRVEYEDETLNAYDYCDGKTSLYLAKWRRLIYDPVTGAISLANAYKTTGTVVWHPPGTANFQQREFRCVGLWLKSIKFGDGDMEANAINLIDAQFCVDKIFPHSESLPTQ